MNFYGAYILSPIRLYNLFTSISLLLFSKNFLYRFLYISVDFHRMLCTFKEHSRIHFTENYGILQVL